MKTWVALLPPSIRATSNSSSSNRIPRALRPSNAVSRSWSASTNTSKANRHRWLTPYLFLVPGGLWLLAFFVVPMIVMASVSLQEGSLGTGYRLTAGGANARR